MFDSTEWCVALLMYHRCVVQKFDTRATRIKDEKKRFDKFGRAKGWKMELIEKVNNDYSYSIYASEQ